MAFPDRPLAENASRNERSDWDAFSGSAFKRKLRPGFWLQSGMPFPVEVSGGSCIPESSFRVGRAFPSGAQVETTSRIQASEWDALSGWASSGNCVPESTWLQVESASQNASPAFLAVVVGKGSIAYTRDDGVAVIPMAALGA